MAHTKCGLCLFPSSLTAVLLDGLFGQPPGGRSQPLAPYVSLSPESFSTPIVPCLNKKECEPWNQVWSWMY